MNRIAFLFILMLLISGCIYSQSDTFFSRQTNVSGKDVMADMPWRMQKNNVYGNPNGLPVLVYIKDADVAGAFADVVYIDISIKNADDAAFGSPLTFGSYSNSSFLSLFSCKSTTDATFGVQDFDATLPIKDNAHTIQFTADYSSLFDIYYSRVDQEFWYFVFTIPPEKLAGFDDVIDVKVYFSLDWEADDELYFRIFRSDERLPSLPGFCRGDVHYHTLYTNNSAEYGCPIEATKIMAEYIGLDWIASTNHSCDYDNYGAGIQQNWSREKNEIQTLNSQDSSLILIHALEASLVNSNDDVVHMLCYPDPANPLSLPYIGDGNGDLSSTDISIDDALNSLQLCNGFAYAAHPFATGDKLSGLIDGGIWNLNEVAFPSNGASMPGHDVVICNDLSAVSDLYSVNATELFKNNLSGGQIWNYRNTLYTTDESFNPWDVLYDSGTDMLVPYDTTNITEHYNRLLPGLEVSKFLWRKGLQLKNANHNLQNYRFFISAGTDAHGDFNYCNTNFVYGVTGDISDNALGKLSTLVFCPSGNGSHGEQILAALKQGHCIMSDGPVISLGLDANQDGTNDYICGDEALMSFSQFSQTSVMLNCASSDEFGRIRKITLYVGTQSGEVQYEFNFSNYLIQKTLSISLDSLALKAGVDAVNEYFYIRAELETYRDYGTQSALYGRSDEVFHAYTNPVWIVHPDASSALNEFLNSAFSVAVYPNPYSHSFVVSCIVNEPSAATFSITDLSGKMLYNQSENLYAGSHEIRMNPLLQSGLYFLSVQIGQEIKTIRLLQMQ